MNIAAMRVRVTFQKNTVTVDKYGNHKTGCTDYFSCYWIADRAGRTIKRLNELYATNGQVGFTCTERVDGKLILSEGIKILDMKATSGS